MRGRILAGLALAVLVVLLLALFRSCRTGNDLPDEPSQQAPPAEESHYRQAPEAAPPVARRLLPASHHT